MPGLSYREFANTSYLEIPEGDSRTVPLQPCYLGDGDWELWFPVEGELTRIATKGVSEGLYFGKEPASESDAYMSFFDVVLRRLYLRDVTKNLHFLLDDVQNLGASLAKLEFLFAAWRDDSYAVGRRFVVTEIEYVFATARSMFDLLHKVAHSILERTECLSDNSAPIQEISRKSFARIALHGDNLRSADEMMDAWNMPPAFAKFYTNSADFFRWMRNFRDKISHQGRSAEAVYITERGFAVSTKTDPFDALDIWCEENMTGKNDLGSVRALLGHVVSETLLAMEDLAVVLQSMKLPPDVAPGYRVWISGRHLDQLSRAQAYVVEEAWFDEQTEE